MYGALKIRGIKYSNVETLVLFAPLSKFLAMRLDHTPMNQLLLCQRSKFNE